MFDATAMLFIYVETPLHAGAGRGLGAVDLPIQRERTTDYPLVQSTGVKGRLRAATDPARNAASTLSGDRHRAMFGPETANAGDHAGALAIGDARLLLFPVRTLAGVFAWTSSRDALARFRRMAELAGLAPGAWELPNPGEDTALVAGDALLAGENVVLEEFSFAPNRDSAATVRDIGRWLAANALPAGEEYAYWRAALPEKLCILPEDAFRDFARFGTEVQTHVKLEPDTKTVAGGALWTSESLPVDTLLYAPLLATASRATGTELSAREAIEQLAAQKLGRLQLGGDETTGQGIVSLRFSDVVSNSTGGATR